VELPKRAIQLFSAVGDLVIDPFGGIASTQIAAMKLRRRWIYSDASETYRRRAMHRMQQEIKADEAERRRRKEQIQ
jgi:site-specific DNA-methyltransferase (adenine-specific)